MLGGKVGGEWRANQPGDDPAVLAVQTGIHKRPPVLLPLQGRVGGDTFPFFRRHPLEGSRQVRDGLLDAVIGRGQLQSGVKHVQVPPELVAEGLHGIRMAV